MKSVPCFQVDAFAARPFTGNPAAVCPLTAWLDDALMQNIAAENALSETAFFVKNDDVYDLRWFTPETEVDLCGHATLASAHVLMNVVDPSVSEVTFRTRSGSLNVRRLGASRYELDFPARRAEPGVAPEGLFEALGVDPAPVLWSGSLVVVLARVDEVRAVRPDFERIRSLGVSSVCVTAPGAGLDADVDFVSRFFAPIEGIPEDPVTGSAHCTLAPYWGERLSKRVLSARQVSRRTGEIECELDGDRVLLRGSAITTRTGSFVLPASAQDSDPVDAMSTGVIAVVFSSVRTEGDRGYEAMATAMVDLAAKQPGFLGVESARGADGVGITVSYWATEADVIAWKRVAAHRIAQDRGRSTWYRGFRMRVCRVERAYAFGERSW